MSKIVITGGSGFIGTNLVEFYLEKGFSVLNIDIKEPKIESRFTNWKKCDINDLDHYKQLILDYDPQYFIHLAARTDLNESKNIEGYKSNIQGVKNTIEAIKETNIVRTLFASSRMVCKIGYQPQDDLDYCPPNLYGRSKMMGEEIVRKSKIKCEWTIFRPTSIWGEYFEIPYRTFFDKIKKGQYFNPGHKKPLKSFGYIGNSCFQIDKILFADFAKVHGKTLYVADYPPLKLQEWSLMVAKEMGNRKVFSIPIGLLKPIAFFGDLAQLVGVDNPALTSFRLNNLIANMVYDTSLLEEICGELPYSLQEGVTRTVNWLNSNT